MVTELLLSVVDEPNGMVPVESMISESSWGDVGMVSNILVMTGRPNSGQRIGENSREKLCLMRMSCTWRSAMGM